MIVVLRGSVSDRRRKPVHPNPHAHDRTRIGHEGHVDILLRVWTPPTHKPASQKVHTQPIVSPFNGRPSAIQAITKIIMLSNVIDST